MARPLPKDVEAQIAGVARRSEIRSALVMGFMIGTAFGVGLGAVIFRSSDTSWLFAGGAGVLGLVWLLMAWQGRRVKVREPHV